MLSYNVINKFFDTNSSNYINSIAINFVFSLLVIPSVIYAENSVICRYWFFSLIIVYLIFYNFLKKSDKV